MAIRPAKLQPKQCRFHERNYASPIHKMHCVIHQEALCAKSANLVDVMSVVVKVVNYTPSPEAWITASSRHWLSRSTCNLLYFCKVRWQSRWAMHVVPCMRPVEGDRHLSSSEDSSLRWSVLRPAIARSPSPAEGHDNGTERPQREAAEQIHPSNRQARTQHRLRGKVTIVGGAAGCCSCTRWRGAGHFG